MPHKEEPDISIVELHPTFAAEVRGVDFSQDIPADVFGEIKKAIARVLFDMTRHGVMELIIE